MTLRSPKPLALSSCVTAVVILGFAIAQTTTTETKHHTISTLPPEIATKTDNLNDRFWLFLPERYARASAEKPMALIIYLHGSSRRGRNIEEVKANGLAPLMDERDDFEFVVASPQALSKYPWQRCWQPDDLLLLLDHLLANYHIDPKRVYLTGLSMGGYGTWAAIGKHPDRFAAEAVQNWGQSLAELLVALGKHPHATVDESRLPERIQRATDHESGIGVDLGRGPGFEQVSMVICAVSRCGRSRPEGSPIARDSDSVSKKPSA